MSFKKKESNLRELDLDELVGDQVQRLRDKDLPEIIIGQFEKLKQLEKLNKDSKKAADSARRKALEAKEKTIGWFNKKDRIEDLQSVSLELAQAVQTLTETQDVAFGHHTELAEISKYLFGIGVSNISANRFVVRELEMRLKGASEEELSELARQELTNVVMQLKAQEDVIKKQEKFAKLINGHDNQLIELYNKNQEFDEKMGSQIGKIEEVEKQIVLKVKEFEEVDGKLNLEVIALNNRMLDIEDEVKSFKIDTSFEIKKSEGKLIFRIESCKATLDQNHNYLLAFSNMQKKKINLLITFLVINLILVVVLAYFSLHL